MVSRMHADDDRPERPFAAALAELRATGRVSTATLAAARAQAMALPPPPAERVAGRPYTREVLYAEADVGEVMRATWAPGVRSAPHDHGGARGLVAVLEGRFEERGYAMSPSLGLCERAVRELSRGDVLEITEDRVHAMTSHDARGVTLHVYAGDVASFRLFDETARVTLRARGGAWLPADVVLSEERWEPVP